MADTKRINEIIKRQGIKKKILAQKMGIQPSTLTRRLKGDADFKTQEASDLANILGLTPQEKIDIFLR